MVTTCGYLRAGYMHQGRVYAKDYTVRTADGNDSKTTVERKEEKGWMMGGSKSRT
jgi:hypothetical protein